MSDCRVHVPRMSYRGADKKKLEKQRRDHELCVLIEVELQRRYDEIKPGEMRAIMSHEVAWAIGEDMETVRRIICRVQGGSNGVTFGKPPYGRPTDKPTPEPLSDAQTSSGRLVLGQRVDHAKFGEGEILHIEGDKVEATFGDLGVKRVLESFLSPSSL